MSNEPLQLDDITLTTQLQQEQDYVVNNALIIDKIKKLEDAVIGLIGKRKLDNKQIEITIEKMRVVAKRHANFIFNNPDQIESVKSSKSDDIFLLGADMLQDILKDIQHNNIEELIKSKFPIESIKNDDLNVISGGKYHKNSYGNNVYDNIAGSALLNSKQAMLIALYAQLENINIVNNYGDVLKKLQKEKIMDYKNDSNLTIKPIKNPKGTSPFMVDGFLVEPTVGYEFGGKRDTKGNDKKYIYDCSSWIEDLFKTGTLTTGNMVDAISKETNNDFRNKILTKATIILHYNKDNNKDIMSNLEDGDMFVWRGGHVGFVKMIDGKPQMLSYTRERGESGNIQSYVNNVKKDLLDNILSPDIKRNIEEKINKIIKAKSNQSALNILSDCIQNLNGCDINIKIIDKFAERVKQIIKIKKEMHKHWIKSPDEIKKYAIEKIANQEKNKDHKDHNQRTDEHFKGKRTNIDGFTLEGGKSFEELIKKKDLYIIKFDLNKEGADIPIIEEPEKNNTLCR